MPEFSSDSGLTWSSDLSECVTKDSTTFLENALVKFSRVGTNDSNEPDEIDKMVADSF